MLRSLREAIKRTPVLGPRLYHAYLVALHHEGRVETIRGGILEGMRFKRFMRTCNDAYVAGDYESDVQEAFATHIKPGQVVYDVGSNVGFMTLVSSKLVGPTGTVIAFEPSRETARQLAAQVKVNDLKNVIVKNCAVSDREGVSRLNIDSFSDMARLDDPASGNGEGSLFEQVATTTLDKVAMEHPAPDFLKIDVEGAEMMVLNGATRLLRDRRPVIVIELHSEELSRQFHHFIIEYGYDLWTADGIKAEPGDFRRFVIGMPTPV